MSSCITMTGRFEGMREAELDVLERTRLQAGRVARIRARCSEIAPKGQYKSPRISGMPGGSKEPCGLDGSKRECEALLAELEREEKCFDQLARQSERIISRSTMKPEMREFCRNYYIRRMSVEGAAENIGRTGRTGWNYKNEIEMIRRAKNPAHSRKNEPKNDQKNFQ